MFTQQAQESMNRFGYAKFEGLYNAEELEMLKVESEALIERTYNQTELENHSVYPSDSTETRVSHAMMISEGPSSFPKVEHTDLPAITKFLKFHNEILSKLTGVQVAPSSRCMLNYQNYYEGSKPVAEHFDGEFLRTERTETVEFNLLEGILPRFVSLIILANENDGKGVELLDNERHHVYSPRLRAGDFVIFDNINLRHRVPSLEKPRTSIGLRNFDHIPLHFARTERDKLDGDYRRIAEGFVSENVDCHKRFEDYMTKEWPAIKSTYSHYF